MTQYKSRTALVDKAPMELFNRATDLQGIMNAIPEEKKAEVMSAVTVDGDAIRVSYAGFSIGIEIVEKVPFSKVTFKSDSSSPFPFTVELHFDEAPLAVQTNLWIQVDAELNFMMRSLLGGKIQQALDQIINAIATGGFLGQ